MLVYVLLMSVQLFCPPSGDTKRRPVFVSHNLCRNPPCDTGWDSDFTPPTELCRCIYALGDISMVCNKS